MSQRFRIRADVDDLWQTVQPGPFSEKQPQWLTLQLCLVTVGVTEWSACSRLNHLFYTNVRRKLTPGSVLGPLRGRKGKTRPDDERVLLKCKDFIACLLTLETRKHVAEILHVMNYQRNSAFIMKKDSSLTFKRCG